tara:strand:+ start:921 stop:2786 length:1866 start_codon:yes stop_codon:yes gene_type:complete
MTYSPQGLGIVTQGTSQIGKFISTHGTTGDVIIPDSDKFSFGTGSDASIYFDATNLVIADENIPVSIGHASSTVTIAGNLTVTGTTTTVNVELINSANGVIFEGATDNAHETTLIAVDPTADAIIKLPAMAAGTFFLPVLAVASTVAITSTPAELNILDGVTATAAQLNYLAGITLGTAAASKAMTWAANSSWTAAGGTCTDLGIVTTVDINGGTIDGAVIGGASTAAGSFAALAATTGTFSGVLKTDDATDATSTTDGSLQTDGGLSVAKDTVIGNDLIMLSDASVIHFGGNKEVTLTHVHDSGLTLKHTATADDKPVTLTLATGETDMAADDVIGVINFQAPDEGTGTDAILVAAGIAAVSEGDFSSSNNATKLSFRTAASEAASEKMSLSSGGNLTVLGDIVLDDGGSLKEAGGTAAFTFDGSGNVTKIGVTSPTSGHFLKWDGAKWVPGAATVSGLACDDLTVGDGAVTLSTSSGNITIETQANDTDIIFNVDDGGSQITALTLDGSDDGAAIFKSTIKGTVFKPAVEVISSANVTVSNGYTAITTADVNRVATMPEATAALVGSTYTVKKVDSGTGNVSVTSEGDGLIDGGASVVLYHQFESVTVICRAADVWDIM